MKNLDRETYSFTLTELAGMTGVHRQTVAKRLTGLSPEPGSNGKRKRYFVVDALNRIYLNGDIVKVTNKAEGLDELLPDLLEEYQRQSSV